MSKKLFTEEKISILKQNKYVKKVSSKGITKKLDMIERRVLKKK